MSVCVRTCFGCRSARSAASAALASCVSARSKSGGLTAAVRTQRAECSASSAVLAAMPDDGLATHEYRIRYILVLKNFGELLKTILCSLFCISSKEKRHIFLYRKLTIQVIPKGL